MFSDIYFSLKSSVMHDPKIFEKLSIPCILKIIINKTSHGATFSIANAHSHITYHIPKSNFLPSS